jgi:hypothetical protein
VLDIHQEQLLVLLLVVETELHQISDGRLQMTRHQGAHRLVDVGAISGHLGRSWSGR